MYTVQVSIVMVPASTTRNGYLSALWLCRLSGRHEALFGGGDCIFWFTQKKKSGFCSSSLHFSTKVVTGSDNLRLCQLVLVAGVSSLKKEQGGFVTFPSAKHSHPQLQPKKVNTRN